ncbi:class E sortase [Streptomyces caniscabiei]|uniref:Class E sortase n=1 Tax=Streptomyces caniscabiei TaxID=2746961 RepID=A0A927L275_9ACTN|nr:class E sortase [Streptomyces caniscabiei]MBD9701629.1 class E sortase [Streptomyces caniscabiei]MBD9724636.1 class E sortase [Streptomyces caniscabiei]MDX3508050.1 class E sortase [Streptomyces caniscabiei]MDX3718012.1 class E sortase [Streptomyces caniscabiei]MDX3726324.1 class E sortase [Streptomyces caniscabiei]
MSVRVIVRTASELCITVGTLIVLFVVYVLFWTGVRADSEMEHQVDRLQDRWAKQPVRTTSGAGPSAAPEPPAAYESGEPFALMYIPRLGSTWNKPVLEGTKTDTLKKGLGHYANTAQLGQKGNFAVAGHRRTHGDPFKDFPNLRPGDKVVLTDGSDWFTYVIDKGPYRTLPTDVQVIDPVPKKSGYTRAGRYLTLTTCDPEWGHSHRLIVWGHLDSTQPVESGKPEALRR